MTKKERFILWLNKLGRGCNRITIVVLYITIMVILGTLIYGANQQRATSNVTVTYSRPSYTVTFDPAGGGSSSSKIVKLGDNYGDLPTPTKTGYTFNGWQTSDGTAVTSTTQNTTIGDHTLSASWTARTYSVTSGANLTGVSVSVSSTGTFGSGLSISSSGSATGYDYTFTDIKVYSGTSTSGTLLATYTSTSATFTMTGTYYDNIYVYATWARSGKSYTVTSGSNLTGTSVSVGSTGTFGSGLSISSSGSAAGYSYSISNIKVYSGSNTSGTLLATINATSGTFTMTGTYYSSVYVYATWSRSAIATTISKSSNANYIYFSDSSGGSITITAGGGGGKWKYSVISATRDYPRCNIEHPHSDPNKVYTLSTTSETTGSVTLTCKGNCCGYIRKPGSGVPKQAVVYTYVVQAESVYNGTKATVTVKFSSQYWDY